MKEDLDILSGSLVEDENTLTRMRAVHNAAKGLHEIVRTFPTIRGAA